LRGRFNLRHANAAERAEFGSRDYVSFTDDVDRFELDSYRAVGIEHADAGCRDVESHVVDWYR
jgi:hypothetical protein